MLILFLVNSKKKETVFGKESEFIMSPRGYFFSLSFILLPIINLMINSVALYETKCYIIS